MLKDYSQDREQAAILKAVLGQTDLSLESLNPVADYDCGRRFLDIGAWDPFTFSNTAALYELGWKGVLIEPSPAPLRKLVETYGNDPEMNVISAAVAIIPGMSRVRITDDAVSSSDAAIWNKWELHAEYLGWMLVPSVTISDILNRFGKFEFVNIDAEGVSVDLLKVLLATEMFPKCICCEHDDRLVEAISAATDRGYKVTFTNQANVIFSL